MIDFSPQARSDTLTQSSKRAEVGQEQVSNTNGEKKARNHNCILKRANSQSSVSLTANGSHSPSITVAESELLDETPAGGLAVHCFYQQERKRFTSGF